MTISMRVLPRFPARVMATDGLTTVRDGTDIVIHQDWSSLIRIPAVVDPNKVFFETWNSDLDLYSIMSFTDTFAAVIDTTGLMAAATYDPQNKQADAFARANHTGTQAISTISGLQSALDAKLAITDFSTTLSTAINSAPAKANLVDADKFDLWDTATSALATVTLANLVSSIFRTTRKIANAYFVSSFRLWDATDNTKGLGWVLSGVATATVRLITMPDRDIDLGNVSRGRFTSADQTITSGGLLTLAHSLGARPEDIQIDLVCTTADAGWAVGDVIQNVSDINTIASTNISNARYADATNVYYRMSNAAACFSVANKGTGATTTIANANWKIRFRATRY